MAKRDPIYRIAVDFRKGILNGKPSNWMCRAVCLPLQGYLGILGYEVELRDGVLFDTDGDELYHTWLRLPDGRILDPTADQFNEAMGKSMPPVYIGELPEWYQEV